MFAISAAAVLLYVLNIAIASEVTEMIRASQRHVDTGTEEIVFFLSAGAAAASALASLVLVLSGGRLISSKLHRFSAITILTLLFINMLYWGVAVFFADGACIQCGGFYETIFFWVDKAFLN